MVIFGDRHKKRAYILRTTVYMVKVLFLTFIGHLQGHASSLIEPVLPLAWLDQLSALQRLAWQACDTIQRYNALEGGIHSNDQVHSSPRERGQGVEWRA